MQKLFASSHTEFESAFKPNDRVIVQSVNKETIAGRVRWVGSVKLSSDSKVKSVVGIETVSTIILFEELDKCNYYRIRMLIL